MPRGNVSDLQAFLAVARERSFTRAAAQLGVSQSALSHTIRSLEERLGLRLLTRTTRSVAPTIVGERLVRSLGPRFEEIDAELASLSELRGKPAGTIRITAGEHAVRTILWRALAELTTNYSDIKVEVIAITPEQIMSLQLPRAPIVTKSDGMTEGDENQQRYKWAATRRDNFEKHLGEGGTELNAIDDADLVRIIRERVEFYHDGDLRQAFADAEEMARQNSRHAVAEIAEERAEELADLRRQQVEIVTRYQERVDELNRQIAEEMAPVRERSEEIRHAVQEQLDALDPDLPPRPEGEFEDREDAAYLYDSSRDFIEQMRHYRRRQGKEREWAEVEHRLAEGE